MRGWRLLRFGGPEGLRFEEISSPEPGPHEVRVRVAFAGINPVDRSTIQGRFDFIRLPTTPGAEIVGRVEGVGPGVMEHTVGERVAVLPTLWCGTCRFCERDEPSSCLTNPYLDRAPQVLGVSRPGGWAEEVVVPDHNLVRLPPEVSLETAVTFPVGGVAAHHALRRARLRPQDTVLVMGASGTVGSFAVQIARQQGARAFAVVSQPSHVATLKELGAEEAWVRTTPDLVQQVRGRTGGLGADVVVDPLGAASFATSLECLAPMGRLVTCGILTGNRGEVDLTRHYSRQLEYIGSTTGSRSDLETLVALASKGRIKPLVQDWVPFASLPEGLAKLNQSGRLGKVILRIQP